ncbi:MAG: glycosyltransferase family 39 protein [Patescibacteria group bacterium]
MLKALHEKFKCEGTVCVFILFYIVIASYKLSLPGLHYDEVFYTNAALGSIDDNFVYFKIGAFPVMIMDYIGALKAWVYGSIFKFFGVSPLSIRFPNILITAVSLWLLYLVTKRLFEKKIARLTVFLLSVDPTFIILTRLDFGPVVLAFLIRVLMMYFFILFLKKKKGKYLIIASLLSALGIFNKLDFVWFVNAMILGSLIVYRKRYLIFWNKRKPYVKTIFLAIIATFTITVGYAFMKTGYYKTIDFFYWSHFTRILKDTGNLIDGSLFFISHFGNTSDLQGQLWQSGEIYNAIFWAIIFFQIVRTISVKDNNKKHATIFMVLLAMLIYWQIIVTSLAGASWHLFTLYPFLTILFAKGLSHMWQEKRSRWIAVILLGFILIRSISIYSQYLRSFEKPKSIFWSPAIYELIKFTKQTDARFVAVDWGIHNALQTYDHKKDKYFDMWTTFIKDPADLTLSDSETYYILYPQKDASFKQPRKSFFTRAKQNKINMTKIKEIRYKNETIFELYKAK